MSSVFNPNSSTREVNNIVNVIDSNGNSLVDTYLSKNGGIVNGSLILEGINSYFLFYCSFDNKQLPLFVGLMLYIKIEFGFYLF
jgi:hypothetical protein